MIKEHESSLNNNLSIEEISNYLHCFSISIKNQEEEISKMISMLVRIVKLYETMWHLLSELMSNIEAIDERINEIKIKNCNNKESLIIICNYLETNFLKNN